MSGTRRKPGRMGPFIDGFQSWLVGRCYAPGTVQNILKVVGQLGRWMDSAGLEPCLLDESRMVEFVSASRASGAGRVPGPRAMAPLLTYLKSEGVVAAEVVPATPLEVTVAAYRTWLVAERGLAGATVLRYENLARRFLGTRVGVDGGRLLENLTGADVSAFLLRETARVSVGSAKGRVAELRSLLRFLYLKGLIPLPMATAVPPVAGWRDTSLPNGLTAEGVDKLLGACDRTDPAGVRDFAILMLVARLGLRSAEVARLELSDIDWRTGKIAVRGKARRHDRLPLPCDVGEALSAYLCGARPATSIRQVFLARKAPIRAIRADLVSDVCRRACQRAGLLRVGAHRLRHALATELLHRGATIVEFSQVLRHRDLATTAIYDKVDVGALRGVAQPWSGAVQ